jgi:hypothetical protein
MSTSGHKEIEMTYVSTQFAPLLSVEATRAACGGRGRAWVYQRIAAGDFETITDGSRRLIVTESVLQWLEQKRGEARERRGAASESPN